MRFVLLLIGFLFSGVAFGDTPPNNPPPNPPPAQTDAEKLAAALKREEDLKAELEKLKKPKDKEGDENDILKRAREEKEAKDKAAAQTKSVERAVAFNLQAEQFVKDNAKLLPSDMEQVVKIAAKDTYDSAHHRACVLQSAIVQSYFAIQANVDMLTAAQKSQLDDFLKLTKTGKEQKAPEIYENLFEPTLETVRKIKKAEEVGRSRSGHATSTDAQANYREKLIKIARKTHLGEKE